MAHLSLGRRLDPGGLIGDGMRRISIRFGVGVGRSGLVERTKFFDALLMADASLVPHP